MSRVHCIDCGSAVVVDPAGFCPDGHLVGADGTRIEAAIGVAVPYPDEPEPWVASVELDPGAAESPSAAQPRAARPPAAPTGERPPTAQPSADATSARTAAPPTAPAPHVSSNGHHSHNGHQADSDPDDLLRELHALSELGDLTAPARSPARPEAPAPDSVPPASTQPTSPPPASAPPASAPPASTPAASTPSRDVAEPVADDATAPTNGQQRDGLAELHALEAAVHALTGSSADELATVGDPDVGADAAHGTNAAPEPHDARPEAPAAREPGTATGPGPVPEQDGVVRRLPTPESAPTSQDVPDREHLAEVEELFARRPRQLNAQLPSQRPSQNGPPSETVEPQARPQHTPWAADPTDEHGGYPAPSAPPMPSEPPSAPSPGAAPAPPAHHDGRGNGSAGSDAPLDLGNFTASGKRVGSRGEGKRRRRGR